jgi:hypothetical protein
MKSIKEQYRSFLNTENGGRTYNTFKRILYSEEDSLVQILDNDVLQDLPLVRKDLLTVCDIGGGDGNRIIHILKYLHGKFHIRFQLDFVEQSQPYIDAFDASSIDGFTETGLFHGLFEKVELPKKYDLVFLIHSIFAFEKGNAIGKALSLPNQDGKIIIVSNAPTSFLAGLKSLIDDAYDDRRYEIDGVCDDLNNRGIDYRNVRFQTKWAIDRESYDQDISTILEWLSLGTFRSFCSEKKNLAFDYIEMNTIESNGRVFFSEDEVIVIAPGSGE